MNVIQTQNKRIMKLKKYIGKAIFATVFACMATSASAQDLLAHQAPVDRRSTRVDTVMMQNFRHMEDAAAPSSELYSEWTNGYAYKQTELPETYKIDLRGFHMPTPSRVITSDFGPRWGRNHRGLDIKVYIGDTIRAAFSGKVRVVKYEGKGYGKYIVIRHNNGLETIYGHLSKQLVHEDQIVRAGDVIGLGGNTGRSTGSHLHFETRLCGVALNPAIFFDFPNQDITCDVYTFHKNSRTAEDSKATRLRGKVTSRGYSKENIQGTVKTQPSNNSVQPDNSIPTPATRPEEPHNQQIGYHRIETGETLESIARDYNTTVERLCKLNGVGKYTTLTRGQTIRIS